MNVLTCLRQAKRGRQARSHNFNRSPLCKGAKPQLTPLLHRGEGGFQKLRKPGTYLLPGCQVCSKVSLTKGGKGGVF